MNKQIYNCKKTKNWFALGTSFVPSLHKHLGTGKWSFNVTFCVCIHRTSPRLKQHIHTFVLVTSTHSQFGPSTGNAYTVLHLHKHHAYVIPLSLCKYTLFSKSEDHLFMQSLHLCLTRIIITQNIWYLGAR